MAFSGAFQGKTAEPEIVTIPIETIMCDDRLRGIDQDHVDLLAVSMEEFGLRSPLWVQMADGAGLHSLIAGAHRLAAAKQLGWTDIRCEVLDCDGIDARLLEIDENLFRRELNPLDRSVFLAERKALYEARYPEAKRGAKGLAVANDQTDKLVSLVPSFAEETAIKLGVDARTVFRAIARAEKIAPDVRKTIATTWIAAKGSVLDALVKLEADEQRAVVRRMLGPDGEKSVAAALAALRGDVIEADGTDGELQRLLKAWRGAGKAARDQFIDFLVGEGAALHPDA